MIDYWDCQGALHRQVNNRFCVLEKSVLPPDYPGASQSVMEAAVWMSNGIDRCGDPEEKQYNRQDESGVRFAPFD
jgi:hypothetical protein